MILRSLEFGDSAYFPGKKLCSVLFRAIQMHAPVARDILEPGDRDWRGPTGRRHASRGRPRWQRDGGPRPRQQIGRADLKAALHAIETTTGERDSSYSLVPAGRRTHAAAAAAAAATRNGSPAARGKARTSAAGIEGTALSSHCRHI